MALQIRNTDANYYLKKKKINVSDVVAVSVLKTPYLFCLIYRAFKSVPTFKIWRPLFIFPLTESIP